MHESLDITHLTSLRKDQFEALYQISRLLNAAEVSEALIAEALDLVIRVMNAERGLFARYDRKGKDFSIITARNIAREDIQDLSEFSSGILNRVVTEKRAQLYHDAQSDPTLSQFDSVQIHNIKSVVGVPILLRGNVWGVLLVDSRSNRAAFTEDNLQFLEFFANLVSLSLDKIMALERLRDENRILYEQLASAQSIPNMIGQSPAMRQTAQLIHKVARTDASVLLLGESGTGKDLAAQAIHQLSPRKDRPFLAQFCGSIPDSLLESELFGYKKGAFSGATSDKKGLFEVASSGTFFLDEIGEISMALQAKLLRVLQNQEIIRLGDTQVKKVDVRIIAATNQDLKELVAKGKFRQDLFYRLNVFPITLPPLRERRSDIVLLTKHFVGKYGRPNIRIHPDTIKKLESYFWPGNVRQLENVIQRALILCDEERLLPEHIILEDNEDLLNFSGTLRDFEKRLLLQRLKKFEGNRTQTARSLGVSVRWVQLKLKDMDRSP